MPYKVICAADNYNKTFNDCVDALIEYNKHNDKKHTVTLTPVGNSTYETFKACLEGKGVYNSVFRISQNPLGVSFSVPTGGSAKSRETILMDAIDPPEAPPKNRYNFYFERLVKLVPSEIVGLYLALYALGIQDTGMPDGYGKWISIICFLLVFVSRIFGTKITGYNTMSYFKTAQWGSIVISAISFVIWVFAMGHNFAGIGWIEQSYIKAAVILWTFIVPMIYTGDK